MCTELEWDGGNNTAQMSTCSLYQEGNAILMKNPPDEGIVDVGVTKYRSYLFLAVAYGSRVESSKLGVSGTEHLAHPAEWIGVDDALQSSAQHRDAQKNCDASFMKTYRHRCRR
jgi:hypothetical protein